MEVAQGSHNSHLRLDGAELTLLALNPCWTTANDWTQTGRGRYRWTFVRSRVSVGFTVVFSEESMTVGFMIDKQTREEAVNGQRLGWDLA